MAVSPDNSSLYVSVQPKNRIDVISLSSGAFSTVGSGDVGFPSGIAIDGSGDLLVTRHFTSTPTLDDIATLSLQTGSVTTYLQDSSWMPFLQSGFWADMACDDGSGDIFAEKGRSLYAIDGNRQSHLVHQFSA